MKRTLLAIALVLAACGNNKLTSVTITPAAVVAKHNGTVQFTATGTFSDSSKPVPLTNINWCVGSSTGLCNGFVASAATIDSNGLATCVGSGTVTILAGRGNGMAMPDQGFQLNLFGTANLTCP